ncbi:ribonuclease P protein component [bacterium]|nr:MAG: ribonuclease P protein component [bacterium]
MIGPSKDRFERIFSDGRRASGPIARIACLPGTGLIGFATSRKLGGKPQRNRQRRRFKAALQDCAELLHPAMDYVVILGPSCAEAPWRRITEEARDLIVRANARWAEESESS